MGWFVTALGAAMVLFTLRDMFHTIWHPSGQGALSRLVMQLVWRGSRRLKRRSKQTSMVGPVAMLAVILVWVGAILVGWTLIYWPHMSEGFSFSSGLEPSRRMDLMDSLYVSLVTVATLGYGDIVPTYLWLRLLSPLEALIGFALLTAAVSWILQIYPALARRRALAIRLAVLERSQYAGALHDMDSPAASTMLDSLTQELVRVRVDLTQYAETYYFREADPTASLPARLSYAMAIATAGQASARRDLRVSASALREAVGDFTHILVQQHSLIGDQPGSVLEGYAVDHGYGERDG